MFTSKITYLFQYKSKAIDSEQLCILINMYQSRMLCDCILTSEKLVYQNADYWIECFNLIRRIIGGVDYKGVREIMKVSIILF